MRSRLLKHVPLCAALGSAAWLAVAAPSAPAQHKVYQPYCPPSHVPAPLPHGVVPHAPAIAPKEMPKEMPKDGKEARPDQAPPQMDQPQDISPEASAAAGGEAFASTMMGDSLSVPALAFALRREHKTTAPVPSVRNFKICDNESPRPLDRVFLTFNYFADVNGSINARLGNGLRNVQAFRELIGVEKTLLCQQASVGFRLPYNTLVASGGPFDNTSSDIGDLSVIGKYVLWSDCCTGSLLSGGLAVTFPTGPSNFADSDALLTPEHTTIFQPYVGYIFNRERFYFHGFCSSQIPADWEGDVILLQNDFGVGFRLYQACPCECDSRLITSIIPTLECHINNPLNHRGTFDFNDPAGTSDYINITSGVTIGLGQNSSLALGFVVPVTGPKPFDYEALAQFNWRFGPSAGTGAGMGQMLGN